MRVLYIADQLIAYGTAQKVVAMATEWERRGHAVWLVTARDPAPRRVSDVAPILRRAAPARGLPERIIGEASLRWFYPRALEQTCARLGIDLIYSRGTPPAPGLRRLIRRVPFVLEVNSDIEQEIPRRLRRWSRVRSRGMQLASADGVVFVSRELSRALEPKPRRALVLANACLPVDPGSERPATPSRPTLVLIGYSKHDWSGIDRMPELASALPDLDFVVIGTEVAGPANLRSHPALTQAEADRVMSGCTVGIGPLALYRKNMHEASPLKSRNYLALGLPIIQAYVDTDLSEADGCILELPNRADNLTNNLERIREFAWRAFRDPTLSHRAHALARGRLSLAAKERERLAFFETCRAEHAGARN